MSTGHSLGDSLLYMQVLATYFHSFILSHANCYIIEYQDSHRISKKAKEN